MIPGSLFNWNENKRNDVKNLLTLRNSTVSMDQIIEKIFIFKSSILHLLITHLEHFRTETQVELSLFTKFFGKITKTWTHEISFANFIEKFEKFLGKWKKFVPKRASPRKLVCIMPITILLIVGSGRWIYPLSSMINPSPRPMQVVYL